MIQSLEETDDTGRVSQNWVPNHRLGSGLSDQGCRISVMSTVEPGEIRGKLPTTPPPSAESFEAIFEDLEQIILPGLSHWSHPHFFAFFPSNSSLASVLGDYVSSGLGVLGDKLAV